MLLCDCGEGYFIVLVLVRLGLVVFLFWIFGIW